MTATTRLRRPPKLVLFAASAVLIVLGAVVAYRGLVLGFFEITTGPKGGPSTTVWAVQGKGAARVPLTLFRNGQTVELRAMPQEMQLLLARMAGEYVIPAGGR